MVSHGNSLLSRIFRAEWFWAIMFFALFFTNQMNFRGSEIIAGGNIDFQVLIRLAVLGGVFFICAFYYKKFFNVIREIPLFFHSALLVFLFVITSLPWVFNFYSIYGLITHILMFYIIVVFVLRCGFDKVLYYYVSGVVLFCVVSMLFYYVAPDVGRYSYYNEANEYFQSRRMSGIAGHPNTLGFMAGTGILGFLHLKISKYPINKLLYFGIFIVLACLLLTDSRTSLGGMLLMVGIYLTLHFKLLWASILIGVVSIALVFFSEEMGVGIMTEVLQSMSRSGDIDEITSLTGRSHVWDQMFVLIEKRPFFGWGHATMSHVLASYKQEIGFEVGQAHNLYLQILFSGGFVGLFLYFINLLCALWPAAIQAYKERTPFILCLLFNIMLASFTESIMISSVANNAYLIFVISLAALAVECKEMRKSA